MSNAKDTVNIDDLHDQFESYMPIYSQFPTVRWETDQYPDDVSDTIVYMNDIIDLAEYILDMAEKRGTTKNVPRSFYNDFKMFVNGFNHVYERAEDQFQIYFD
jgi:hypothetical protein